MRIIQKRLGKTRLFEITLDRRDYLELDSGCPDVGYVVGTSKNGIQFLLFPGAYISERFTPMPERGSYHATVGLKTGFPERQLGDLEEEINKTDKMPIIEETEKRKTNLGYVLLRVAKDTTQD